jgi:hypothetical protein
VSLRARVLPTRKTLSPLWPQRFDEGAGDWERLPTVRDERGASLGVTVSALSGPTFPSVRRETADGAVVFSNLRPGRWRAVDQASGTVSSESVLAGGETGEVSIELPVPGEGG